MKFTAIDFETANSSRGSACSIGLVKVENGQIVERFSRLIKPDPLYFDPFNVSIHGITENDVKDAPSFAELWPSLLPKISGPLVAHNAAFDMSVLRHALDSFGVGYPNTDYFCTLVISRIAWPEQPTYALNHIAHAIGVSFAHHDAEEDAMACAHVAMAACKRLGAVSLYDLQEKCGLRVGRLFAGGHCPCGCPRFIAAGTHEKPRIAEIPHTFGPRDERGTFNGMAFVFTGSMSSMNRKDAMRAVVDRGGICHDMVKSDTDFLVLGQEGFTGYQAGHKSSKMKRAEEMRSRGMPIEILSEVDFIGMLENNSQSDLPTIF